ncbi:MAG: IS110 family transposase [Mesoflavibacter sp.]|nr:IS110 family transposase [Mesoflavibacter sp.]
MAKRKQKGNPNAMIKMPVVNPHAAGIDIGSRSHYVCVSQDNVTEFKSHTIDLHNIAQHLLSYNIQTVALESTGFYWQQLLVVLQDYGFEVILVNARHVKNVKGHKTDVVDSKWLQLLHSIGLLDNSFQPDVFTKEIRQYTRHRRSLIETSSKYIAKMNKSLVLMNIQLKTVLRDLTGESGLKVIEAIVNGERNPNVLEKFVGKTVKASRQEIKNALTGDWRSEHLFELSQNYEFYKFTWKKIKETDVQLESILSKWESKNGNKSQKEAYAKKKHKPRQKNDPKFDIKGIAYQMTNGVDLSQIDGLNINTILTMMSETGFDIIQKFKTAKHFASWLGYAPNRKITGGKIMSSNTPKVKNPLSFAIRQAANAAGNSNSRLGDFFRRLAFRKGRTVAIVATARKIAVIIYKMLETGQDFSYEYEKTEIERYRNAQIKKTIKNIKKFDIKIEDLKLAI